MDIKSVNEERARLQARFRPSSIEHQGGWQQRRSAETRVLLLETAIDLLSQSGYAATTTPAIAERAGVSRGAMLHHYPTKIALMSSLIEYLFYRRIEMFHQAEDLTEAQRATEQMAVELLWGTMIGREHEAFYELSAAARTDMELAEILVPKVIDFDSVILSETLRIFPEWAKRREALELARDVNRATLEGLRLNRQFWSDFDRRAFAVRRVLRITLSMIRDGVLFIEEDTKRAFL